MTDVHRESSTHLDLVDQQGTHLKPTVIGWHSPSGPGTGHQGAA